MKKSLFILTFLPVISEAQDLVIFKDGKDVNVKVVEVTKKEIVYKEWDNLEGPVHIVPTSDLKSIHYQNGKKVTFNEEPEIFTYVPQMPQPGFDMAAYLRENLRYPSVAKRKGIQGRVSVKFIIDEFGNVQDAEAINTPLGYGLEEEAVRVVKGMPAFKPGMQDGKPVKVWFSQSINFRLTDQ